MRLYPLNGTSNKRKGGGRSFGNIGERHRTDTLAAARLMLKRIKATIETVNEVIMCIYIYMSFKAIGNWGP